jgi:hypothetical protein
MRQDRQINDMINTLERILKSNLHLLEILKQIQESSSEKEIMFYMTIDSLLNTSKKIRQEYQIIHN